MLSLVAPASAMKINFRAHLTGSQEVPAVDSKGRGEAIFQLNAAGDALKYKLIVANIEDVVQAHIHCGPADANGPVVAFLFGPSTTGGTANGVLAHGEIADTNVIPRSGSTACPGGVADLESLIAQMMAGNTYVNVHTLANPSGEIRGQISH